MSLAIAMVEAEVSARRLEARNWLIPPVRVSPICLLLHDSLQQLSNVALAADYSEVALKLLTDSRYDAPIQIQKILIPDVPPRNPDHQSRAVVASIGGLCAAVTMAAGYSCSSALDAR
jgi:hypothetical protein